MSLRKSLLYLLIVTTVGAVLTYRIIVRAYENLDNRYDIELVPESK